MTFIENFEATGLVGDDVKALRRRKMSPTPKETPSRSLRPRIKAKSPQKTLNFTVKKRSNAITSKAVNEDKCPMTCVRSPLKSPNAVAFRPVPDTAPCGRTKERQPALKSRQRLFASPSAEQDSEKSKETVELRAKRSLGMGLPDQLVGRDREITLLTESVDALMRDEAPGTFYLAGQPGTGKTATVRHSIRLLKKKHKFDYGFVNCMSIRTPADIYRLVLESLMGDDEKVEVARTRLAPADQLADTVRQRFSDSKRSTVLVLDEMDQLASRNHQVLYMAFGWAALKSSRLILIGIANSLDLTERLLPKLKLADPPRLIQFRPYSKDDVIAILRHRLFEADNLLDNAAVELCARKVSALTGDIRKALDICQMAIDKIQRRKDSNGGGGGESVPVAGFKDVLDTVKDVYGSVMTRASVTLPLQQKLLLASCLALYRTGVKSPTLVQLYRAYKKACDALHVPPVQDHEAASNCQLLEACGLLLVSKPTRKQSTSIATVQLLVDERSVMNALNDNTLFASVLSTVG
uniref:Cell division control protein n=1 Tax=Plectus sambesii TaxID=2011161 RepID=A0A914VQ59_9BILA